MSRTQIPVITGGPCCGKTTLCNILAELGHKIVPEASRMIIEEEQVKRADIRIVPWEKLYDFQHLVLQRQLDLESKVYDFAFADRGIIDNIGYCIAGDIAIPPRLYKAVHSHLREQRYPLMFHLDQIDQYHNDDVRKEDVEAGRRIHESIAEAYLIYGIPVVRIPVIPPKERAELVLEHFESYKKNIIANIG